MNNKVLIENEFGLGWGSYVPDADKVVWEGQPQERVDIPGLNKDFKYYVYNALLNFVSIIFTFIFLHFSSSLEGG